MDDRINEINKKSRRILEDYGLTSTQIHIFKKVERSPSKNSINRIFGPPIGISDETWPKYDNMNKIELKEWDGDNRMDHVFTFDLKNLNLYNPENARALVLFISDSQYHQAWVPFNDEVKMLFLSETEINKGEYEGTLPKKQPKISFTFEIVSIKVPEDIFRIEELEVIGIDENLFNLLDELCSLVHNSPRTGGQPIWIQDMIWDPKQDFLLAQFDENFIDINTRDGMMYIFATTQRAESYLNGTKYDLTGFCQFT